MFTFFIGIVKVVNAEEGKMIKKSKNSSMYLLYIEGNHVVNARASSNSTRGFVLVLSLTLIND